MGCLLYFNDRGWDVVTAAWTAGSSDRVTTDIAYQWGGDGSSLFTATQTSTARISFHIPFKTFLKYVESCVSKNEIADLTDDNISNILENFPS